MNNKTRKIYSQAIKDLSLKEIEELIICLGENKCLKIETSKTLKLKDRIKDIIKNSEETKGILYDDLKTHFPDDNDEEINTQLKKLLEDGLIYEPRPARFRWLG